MVSATLFPGQGSQERGMGAKWFDAFPALLEKADEVLGWSVRKLCLEDPQDRLGQTRFTQPALYVVNALSWYGSRREGGPKPDFLAGHSLGEYNALLAADVFDFETGLRLVRKRGELMSAAREGGMAAVVGLPLAQLEAVLAREGVSDVDIANYNAPSQTVISGPVSTLERLIAPFEAAGARRALLLKVSAAFHSRYMVEAAEAFADFLKGWQFRKPRIPVIANVTGRPYGADIYSNLAKQIRASVHWTESMRYLMAKGVADVTELGAGRVLTNLFTRIQQEAEPLDLAREEPAAPAAPAQARNDAPASILSGERRPPAATPDFTVTPPEAGSPRFGSRTVAPQPNGWGSDRRSPVAPESGMSTSKQWPTAQARAGLGHTAVEHRQELIATGDRAPDRAGEALVSGARSPNETVVPPRREAPQKAEVPQGQPADPSPGAMHPPEVGPASLGSAGFRRAYGVRYAYMAGSMYKGIASKELVARMAKAGLLAFLGTGGLDLARVERDIAWIKGQIPPGAVFGMNMLANYEDSEAEIQLAHMYTRQGVPVVEASAFMQVTPGLVLFRFKGAERTAQGGFRVPNRLIAKVSRPEVAGPFMQPAPDRVLAKLTQRGLLTETEAAAARALPVACDVTVEADSGGHTDRGNPYTLMPAMIALRDQIQSERRYREPVRIGAAGGIGSPSSAAAAFLLGADYIVTGSINQCAPESGASEHVKELLAGIGVQDTGYAPAGDLFEVGAKVQVVKRGLFFPARANKLYELYQRHAGLHDLDPKTREMIETKYFRRTFEEVWAETRAYLAERRPAELAKAERNPKQKMAMVFKWYFIHTTRLAMAGDLSQKLDFQIHCGPAMGAFNQVVKGTPLEDWRRRHVDDLATFLMEGAARVINGFNRNLS
ncbi:[Acyl-carrier-protein] S-malonyltransferase [Sulfidibacter corallicola]|uniref:[acyl-carrier-protein] S-malonyltransferase n=1 Tax=Sulfidibacter corallicola TaxID=2818388 RepID=A0A8A4TNP8_SULCO|nr:ACP S-malonyltransferase [Sulfidibacter corallicola]QTD50521.1 ACP S-malonyltransferase [Sulfidibacter corallicola]